MERAIASLAAAPEYLITDAVRIRSFAGPQEPLIHGDARCAVVAAASISAKVYRDALLVELDREDPRYGFADAQGLRDAASHRGAAASRPVRAPPGKLGARARRTARLGSNPPRRWKSLLDNGPKGRAARMARPRSSARGYRVVARNVRVPGGEIDAVCLDGTTLVIVEVKRRDSRAFGSALRSVNARKRATLRRAAADYAQVVAPGAKIRFDVVAVDGDA